MTRGVGACLVAFFAGLAAYTVAYLAGAPDIVLLVTAAVFAMGLVGLTVRLDQIGSFVLGMVVWSLVFVAGVAALVVILTHGNWRF